MAKRFRYGKTLPLWQNASVMVKLFSIMDLGFRYGKTLRYSKTLPLRQDSSVMVKLFRYGKTLPL